MLNYVLKIWQYFYFGIYLITKLLQTKTKYASKQRTKSVFCFGVFVSLLNNDYFPFSRK